MNTRNTISRLNLQKSVLQSVRRSSSDASIAAWIQRMTSTPPRTTIDLVDLERAQQLCRVLPTRTGRSQVLPEWGDGLSKGHHLAYFWPKNENEQLGEDGSSTDYNAPQPYSRRMWAGGSFEWPAGQQDSSAPTGIIIGSSIREQTSVDRIEQKAGMIFVHQLKEYSPVDSKQKLLREIRMHVFRPSVAAGTAIKGPEIPTKTAKKQPAVPEPPYNISYISTPTLPLLFRFSALTFNAHRIHYDATWAREREGHSTSAYGGPVVHGPLSALMCVELVEQWLERSSEGRGKVMRRFEYRATSPMYVDRPMEFYAKVGQVQGEEGVRLWVVQDGRVGMTATAQFH
ncbi:hypothetical protein QFC19_001416 [Naganishia cerealis]|uniref:Uncharacterized protein n=1 Tax=Naganishia cerealis TaxID=610337 RepID=A0ACC2WIK3_9TREE|nr:hypothetical protein QFC19_001416 [Naganishia cerealis]